MSMVALRSSQHHFSIEVSEAGGDGLQLLADGHRRVLGVVSGPGADLDVGLPAGETLGRVHPDPADRARVLRVARRVLRVGLVLAVGQTEAGELVAHVGEEDGRRAGVVDADHEQGAESVAGEVAHGVDDVNLEQVTLDPVQLGAGHQLRDDPTLRILPKSALVPTIMSISGGKLGMVLWRSVMVTTVFTSGLPPP